RGLARHERRDVRGPVVQLPDAQRDAGLRGGRVGEVVRRGEQRGAAGGGGRRGRRGLGGGGGGGRGGGAGARGGRGRGGCGGGRCVADPHVRVRALEREPRAHGRAHGLPGGVGGPRIVGDAVRGVGLHGVGARDRRQSRGDEREAHHGRGQHDEVVIEADRA